MVPVPSAMPTFYPFTDDSRGIGAAEMAYALRAGRKPRADASLGLHAFEAIHGIWESSRTGMAHKMKHTCERPAPLEPSDYTATMREVTLR